MTTQAQIHYRRDLIGEHAIYLARKIAGALLDLGADVHTFTASGSWLLEETEIILNGHEIDPEILNPRVRTIGLGVSRIKPTTRSVVRVAGTFDAMPPMDTSGDGPVKPYEFEIEMETLINLDPDLEPGKIHTPAIQCEDFKPTILLDEEPEEEFGYESPEEDQEIHPDTQPELQPDGQGDY